MFQFFISLLFFMVALTFFWAVLHWVEYKKGKTACACGTGSCSTDSDNSDQIIIDLKHINFNEKTMRIESDHEDCNTCNIKGTDACDC